MDRILCLERSIARSIIAFHIDFYSVLCNVTLCHRFEEIPFSEESSTVDSLISFHAIPSRMIIQHLTKCLQSKAEAKKGRIAHATPFNCSVQILMVLDNSSENVFSKSQISI